MPNSIALIKKYIPLLDEVYKQASKTADLEADAALVRSGAQANEILVPKLEMNGLADYDRSAGYVSGDASLEWETKRFDYDRGRRFTVDAMDNEETAGLAFGKLSSEFIRTKVVPELDAYRFASYTDKAGKVKNESITTGDAACAAIMEGNIYMDEAEVDTESRYLYITPALKHQIDALETYKSKEMLGRFTKIITVPSTRFYSAISLLSGKKDGDTDETIGGYKKADNGKALNFMIIQKDALLQYTKHRVNKIISPETNQSSDGWLFFYRAYGIAEVYDNKKNGIYVSVSTE